MEENIFSFVEYFEPAHCFEFTTGGSNLTPKEYGKRWNSFCTNFLREVMPARIGVLEPHQSGAAHQHMLVALPFTSPDFNHAALAASREAYRLGNKALSSALWQRVLASMSPGHRELFYKLQAALKAHGLGHHISLTPLREGARAVARYFGKYLTKGFESRPDAWKRIRLVRYSGTNGREVPPWKCSTPLRSGNSFVHQNLRDKMRVVAKEIGADSPEEIKTILGPQWFFHGKAAIERVQLPVYRSLLHADADGVPVPMPEDTTFEVVPDPSGDPTAEKLVARFPDVAWIPHAPAARRATAVSPREAAVAICQQAAPFRPLAAGRLALLLAFPMPVTGNATHN